jgi:hypothetical protein
MTTRHPAAAIPGLVPRGEGHQFVLYADSCSGVPGEVEVERHQRVTEAVSRLRPRPEFIGFPGDAVLDGADPAQWERWFAEISWVAEAGIDLYQSTSNHNTHNDASIAQFRHWWPTLPGNGPAGQRGLAYWLRRDDLLYISLHTPDPRVGPCLQTGISETEANWLNSVFKENEDARWIFVAGHYPVYPVNGYTEAPEWCFEPDARPALWDLLVRNRVTAYLCSHVIAFDVQAHQDVLQITTGGAGTSYGPGGFMPGPQEYLHFAQIAVDPAGLRLQTVDDHGVIRETLDWPMPEPSAAAWSAPGRLDSGIDDVVYLEINGINEIRPSALGDDGPPQDPSLIPWLWSADHRLEIGVDASSSELLVSIQLDEADPQVWRGPEAGPGFGNGVTLAFHPAMGPGGVLWRKPTERAWSSMTSPAADGPGLGAWAAEPLVPAPGLSVGVQSLPASSPSCDPHWL